MIVPRFTIRTLLLILTVGALVSIIAGFAIRGQQWAWGITIGLLSLAFTALVHAAWFGVVWIISRVSSQQQEKTARELD
jgi:hypothetical protein